MEPLVAAGADVDAASSEDRWTALHLASQSGNAPVAEALLRCGASVTSRAADGSTPLAYAETFENEDVARIVRNATDSFTLVVLERQQQESGRSGYDTAPSTYRDGYDTARSSRVDEDEEEVALYEGEVFDAELEASEVLQRSRVEMARQSNASPPSAPGSSPTSSGSSQTRGSATHLRRPKRMSQPGRFSCQRYQQLL